MDLTSSWTDAAAASVASTGAAVTVVAATGAAATGAAAGAAAFFVTFFSAATGAAATGAAATGAAAGTVVFLVTVFADLVAEEAFIIPDAVEEFMAKIRTCCALKIQFSINPFKPYGIFFALHFFSLKSCRSVTQVSRIPKSFLLAVQLFFPPCQQKQICLVK
jgi:hypothetical protein